MSADNLDVIKWIQYALMDYNAAVNMTKLHRPVPIEIVCYHCQQSAEKILKAFVIANNETLIKTHDLTVLLSQCSQYSLEFNTHAKSCIVLTTYASLSRYPSNIEINEQQMKQAIKATRDIIVFIIPLFSKMGYVIDIQESQENAPLAWLDKAKAKAAENDSSLTIKPPAKNISEIDI